MNLILIWLGKLVLFFSQTLNLGSGSTWPGHVAMETNPTFVQNILKKNPDLNIVLIAGTNGKTTTSLMLQKLLEEAKLKVFRNEAGANLLNGIASTLIQNSSVFGKINSNVAIFEVDENNLPLVLKEISPVSSHLSVVLLNLFRDQLDRYGEVNTIAKKWDEALHRLPINTTIFTNGDDPKLADIANDSTLVRYYFGIDEKLMKKGKPGYDVDFTYCPNCQTKLNYSKVSYSHLGKFSCPNCGYTNHDTLTFPSLPHPLIGLYNVYNQNAATLVASKFPGVDKNLAHKVFSNFKPAFGRQEIIKYKGRDIMVLLSKNPAGFNQSISAITDVSTNGAKQSKPNILLVLNDRIPDGRDVSWIWDVDMEGLFDFTKNIFVSGDRAYDMGLRIKYASPSNNQEPNPKLQTNVQINENLNEAIEAAVKETKAGDTLFVLATYSAMLETRKLLTGKAIL